MRLAEGCVKDLLYCFVLEAGGTTVPHLELHVL